MEPNLAISLERAEELLAELRTEYERSLVGQTVSERASQLTHEVLERLRSVLDRVARRYWRTHVAPALSEDDRKRALIYFPISNDLHEFDSTLGRWRWKHVAQAHRPIYELFLQRQPFQSSENRWLKILDELAVQGKHIDLVPQTKIEQKWVTVTRSSVQTTIQASWNPDAVRFSSDPGVSISFAGAQINPLTQRIVPTEGVSEKLEIWVSFIIEGYGVNAFAFCEEAVKQTRHTVEEMSSSFGL
ncbi:hypothetical protein C8D77_13312 [Mesorhizobium loti]|uniref:Uncharacterized protein n=1 Tax=Rhizobium loti TaxID=381 RepID=A0A8E3B1H6_RHILI|nr:hypothetical protein [Mesorhizobium loti]PWJ84378.1 hypothetical protein C8D77_13312 [Mesorhizobium loti]